MFNIAPSYGTDVDRIEEEEIEQVNIEERIDRIDVREELELLARVNKHD